MSGIILGVLGFLSMAGVQGKHFSDNFLDLCCGIYLVR